jgi:hypothetical protein
MSWKLFKAIIDFLEIWPPLNLKAFVVSDFIVIACCFAEVSQFRLQWSVLLACFHVHVYLYLVWQNISYGNQKVFWCLLLVPTSNIRARLFENCHKPVLILPLLDTILPHGILSILVHRAKLYPSNSSKKNKIHSFVYPVVLYNCNALKSLKRSSSYFLMRVQAHECFKKM